MTLYVVVDSDFRVRLNKERRMMIYKTQKQAERYARREGDSVVEAVINPEKAPLYIRGVKAGTPVLAKVDW